MNEKKIRAGIKGYASTIAEILEWAKDPRSDSDFDFWMRQHRPLRFEVISPESIILGSIVSGSGADSWGGRLHLMQILVELGDMRSWKDGERIMYQATKTPEK
jgi:hypothetical protein